MKNTLKLELLCPYCDKTFTKKKILDIHIQRFHDKTLKKCPYCDKTFMKEKILEIHILRFHDKIQKSAVEKSFVINSRGYIVHKELKDEYKCANCENTFQKSRELKLHYLNVHFYHYCDICHKSFTLDSSLRKHLREIHKIVKKSKCGNCGQSFDRLKELKKHAKLCEDLINSEQELSRPANSESNSKLNLFKKSFGVVKCPMCDINFSGTMDTLKMHLKFVHKKSEPKLEPAVEMESLIPILESEKEPITFVSVSEL